MKKTAQLYTCLSLLLLFLLLSSCAELPEQAPHTEEQTGAFTDDYEFRNYSFTVTLDANGGYCEETEFVVQSGESHPLPKPKKGKEYFLGWYVLHDYGYKKPGYGERFEDEVFGLQEDVCLIARWFPCNPSKVFSFGRYEQDNDEKNGSEPIEWYCLDLTDGVYMLLSARILDYRPLNEAFLKAGQKYTYEDSWLRKWLTNDFYHLAFSAEEQALMCAKEIRKGEDDYVFIPSVEEYENVNSYVLTHMEPTAFAIARGYSSDLSWQDWWTRTPWPGGTSGFKLAKYKGVLVGGNGLGPNPHGVRPAILVKADAFE